ncbi:MAG: bifunctional adenosylcobinamide kinase/adenosylcobinamide-phosphate guanylyltransferase [Deltaproteobacteria bacterium]|nr:bifunctional adenosylcobinamide kinase/adenosylcobinamide-phosphate guanylyltransferase [Deltaproteobacteria bacterium]
MKGYHLKESVFVIGGCRSGKSSHALKLAEQIYGNQKIFIATCQPHDEEMKKRVARHQKERDPSWKTLESPVLVPQTIIANSHEENVILVDCLTLWVSNLMLAEKDMDEISEHLQRLTQSIQKARCPVILVSNEVGTGIVPENRLARHFRDAVGFANQKVADCCDKVVWMVAGIPVKIK